MYQVGTWTIKQALQVLQQEGFIKTSERRKAVVTYSAPFVEHKPSAIQAILRQKSSILDVYKTMKLLMPEILTFSSRTFHIHESQEYENAIKWAKKPKSTAGQWKVASAFLHNVLNSSNNLLFSNMYAALELHAEVPFLADYQQPLTSYAPYFDTHTVGWFLDFLRSSNRFLIHQCFTEHYKNAYSAMEKSFKKLCLLYPGMEEDTKPFFSWSADKDRYPYYLQIARDLIEKIGIGIYPPGEYLPSEASLAHFYQTSVDTIRRAIRYLNHIGFAHTHNGKGTHAVRPDQYAYRKYSNKTGILLYLSGIQLMTLMIRPAVALVFDSLDIKAQERLEKSFYKPDVIPLAQIMDCIIQTMPLYPFKVILRETDKLLNWGFYFTFNSYEHKNTDYIVHNSLQAFTCLQQGDRKKFARLLFDCYRHIFSSMRRILSDAGIPEARALLTPE